MKIIKTILVKTLNRRSYTVELELEDMVPEVKTDINVGDILTYDKYKGLPLKVEKINNKIFVLKCDNIECNTFIKKGVILFKQSDND